MGGSLQWHAKLPKQETTAAQFCVLLTIIFNSKLRWAKELESNSLDGPMCLVNQGVKDSLDK